MSSESDNWSDIDMNLHDLEEMLWPLELHHFATDARPRSRGQALEHGEGLSREQVFADEAT